MNSKIKKLISILILIVIVVSSLTYYENSTEPQGLQGICNGSQSINNSYNKSYNGGSYLYSDNVSYLGNKADLMLWIFPVVNIFNLSTCKTTSPSEGYKIVYTQLFISNESYAPLYSHLVISVSNFSIAFNKTMFYNVSTNKGDVFGKYIALWHMVDFRGNSNEYSLFFERTGRSWPANDRGNHPWQLHNLRKHHIHNYSIFGNITFHLTGIFNPQIMVGIVGL